MKKIRVLCGKKTEKKVRENQEKKGEEILEK